MSYKKALSALDNVKVQSFSPRWYGENPRWKTSKWREASNLPCAFTERVALIKKLSEQHSQVVIKPATTYGRARIWVM